jgi:hypothetical protein
MKSLARGTLVFSALLSAAQPCVAASSAKPVSAPKVTLAKVSYDLAQPVLASGGSASMTLAASRQAASETEPKRERRGPSTTTIIVVGGVVLLVVLLAAAVAGATPTPGPREGAFD